MITPRLQKIIDLVDVETIADIGTDHAYIPIRLAEDKRITRAVACDKNEGPIEIARANVEKYGFDNIIELRCGDGLFPIDKGEVQTIIIAGMGGNLIGDIIEAQIGKAKSAKLILQPMNAQYELRKRLEKMGFDIFKEELAKEGYKIYNIFTAVAGEKVKKKKEIDYHIPEELLNHELSEMLIEKKKREFRKIASGIKSSAKKDENDLEIVKYCEEMLSEIEKL
ncbi:MAG: class I SAM-dependent methyltransferase [Clostridia bacterium]|nr:class I SAM-dependent methyltransferase [Clostridia bacterium]